MLRGIHKASSHWLGKGILAAVMGLLVLSFAVWGVADIFKGFGSTTIAKIGGSTITTEQFRQYYTDKLSQLGRQLNRPITPDQARALGLEQRIVSQLVAETTLDERTRDLRLGLTDEEIARQITQDKNFAGLNGQFDRGRFEQLIRQASYTEQRYVAEQRRLAVRRELVDSITAGLKPPQAALTAVNRYQGELRTIEYLALGPAQAGDVGHPAPEALAQYFEQRKPLFRAPEYRKITVVVLSPAEQARWEDISDADARKFYEDRKDSFGMPERRRIKQMVFPNADEARIASERIAKGESFAAVAEQRGLKDDDTNLGTVTKSGIIDPAVAAAAFSLKDGEVSAPVQSRFGTAIVQVTKIEPAQQKSFEEVAPQIKRDLALTRARSAIIDLYNKMEDARAAGGTLAEVAQKVGLNPRNIEAVDRSGRAPDNSRVTGLPAGVDVISPAFTVETGVENDPLQLPNAGPGGGGYVWYEVAGVTPSRERNLEEIKDQVEARWRDDEIASRIKTKADDVLAKLKSGSKLSELASANGGKVETASGLQRGRPNDAVPASVIEAAFNANKDQAVVAEGGKPTERFVLRVTGITEPQLDANADATKKLAGTLRDSYSDALLTEFVAHLELDYGVAINQAALNQVVRGSGSSATD